MKHLLTGVAIAAVLAIAAPAWAQNAPMSPSTPKAAAPAPAATMPAQKHHAVRHHATTRRGKMAKSGEGMTEQLNREELSRIQGAPPPRMSTNPLPQNMQASPSPHAAPSPGQALPPPSR